jgi:hypothetical protein
MRRANFVERREFGDFTDHDSIVTGAMFGFLGGAAEGWRIMPIVLGWTTLVEATAAGKYWESAIGQKGRANIWLSLR